MIIEKWGFGHRNKSAQKGKTRKDLYTEGHSLPTLLKNAVYYIMDENENLVRTEPANDKKAVRYIRFNFNHLMRQPDDITEISNIIL